jgi:N-glycosylase/DNA lyase
LKHLVRKVCSLKSNDIKRIVDDRILEFEREGKKPGSEIFKELCFCILTANYNAERAIIIQKEIGDGFINLPLASLAGKLKKLGYRYPNTRAKYIVEARKHKDALKEAIESYSDERMLREWVVKNVKGLGFKEASHFLRNIGYKNLAIIDFHIVDILAENGLIKRPKNLSKKTYLEIEEVLRKLAGKLKLNLAELDLYLWYCETGKILK